MLKLPCSEPGLLDTSAFFHPKMHYGLILQYCENLFSQKLATDDLIFDLFLAFVKSSGYVTQYTWYLKFNFILVF